MNSHLPLPALHGASLRAVPLAASALDGHAKLAAQLRALGFEVTEALAVLNVMQ